LRRPRDCVGDFSCFDAGLFHGIAGCIVNAKYLFSIPEAKLVGPFLEDSSRWEGNLSRVVFIGKSNVGKSSLINSLIKQDIAHVSKSPGKTRAISFFHWLK